MVQVFPGTGGDLILAVLSKTLKPRGSLKFFKNLKPEVLCFWEFSKTQHRRFFDSECFQKETQNPMFFDSESFQKPKTRSSLILKIFKILKPEALRFWQFSKTQNQRFFDSEFFSQNLEPEVINKIKELHNTGMYVRVTCWQVMELVVDPWLSRFQVWSRSATWCGGVILIRSCWNWRSYQEDQLHRLRPKNK